jgi:hypothetical protein
MSVNYWPVLVVNDEAPTAAPATPKQMPKLPGAGAFGRLAAGRRATPRITTLGMKRAALQALHPLQAR